MPLEKSSRSGTIAFVDRPFDGFAGFAGPLLNAAEQFFLGSFDTVEIVIGELAPLLFEAAFHDVPVTFGFELIHGFAGYGLKCSQTASRGCPDLRLLPRNRIAGIGGESEKLLETNELKWFG